MGEICTITLEVLDASMMQIAHAICRINKRANGTNIKAHIVDIDELQKHLKAYVEAEREFEETRGIEA